MKAVITVVGSDKPGIIASVSTRLYHENANILDITQRVIEDNVFTMMTLIEFADDKFSAIKKQMDECAEEIGLNIQVHREEIFNSMHRI